MIQCALRSKNEHISAYSAFGLAAPLLNRYICGVALKRKVLITALVIQTGRTQKAQPHKRLQIRQVQLYSGGSTLDDDISEWLKENDIAEQ